MLEHYPCILLKDPGSAVGVVFPDLPGCVSAGGTAGEALAAAREAAQLYVDELLGAGRRPPRPSPLEKVAVGARAQPGFLSVALVPVRLPGRARRIQITMDATLLEAVDEAAAAAGMSRSGWLAEAARRRLAGSRSSAGSRAGTPTPSHRPRRQGSIPVQS